MSAQKLLLDYVESADVLGGVSSWQLRKWTYGQRQAPKGFPRPVRVGGRIYYRRVDLEDWVAGLNPAPGCEESIEQEHPQHSPTITASPKRRPGRPPNLERRSRTCGAKAAGSVHKDDMQSKHKYIEPQTDDDLFIRDDSGTGRKNK